MDFFFQHQGHTMGHTYMGITTAQASILYRGSRFFANF